MENTLNFHWLWPGIDNFVFPPEVPIQLSAFFVGLLLIVTIAFLAKSLFSYFRASLRVSWLKKRLAGLKSDTVTNKMGDLEDAAKKKKDLIGHLWLEFTETLVEVKKRESVHLYNILDASHFFNSSTLAKGVTENRLVAAVPGFLTAIGVIGTFVGLQLGLSELDISSKVSVEEMKLGVTSVIDGAKIAFLTSVWGVSLSVIFNFIEKLLEQRIRAKIVTLQVRVDKIFLRFSAESQLQNIADSSSQSKESLQGLAERIGEKMQESLLQATQGIEQGLQNSLNKIMAPAIDKLVNETSEGSQKVLGSLLGKFMDGFGQQGVEQRESMEAFVRKIEVSQDASTEREKELISTISTQVSQLVDQSNEQRRILTEFVDEQITRMGDQIDKREVASAEREKELISMISLQVSQLLNQSDEQGRVLTKFVDEQITRMGDQIDKREVASTEREKELISTISIQVDQLLNQSNEQGRVLTKFVDEQITRMGDQIDKREVASTEREKELISTISIQVAQLLNQSNEQGRVLTKFVDEQITRMGDQIDKREVASTAREEELISTISSQVNQLVSQSNEQGRMLTTFVDEQITRMGDQIDKREVVSAKRETLLNEAITQQAAAISQSATGLISNAEESINMHRQASEQILQQGKALQQNVESSAHASVLATQGMKKTSEELRLTADRLNAFGSHIREAGNKLSGAITHAVESTKDLANQNQNSSERMDKLRGQLLADIEKFGHLSDKINQMILTAGQTFSDLKGSQSEFQAELKRNVSDLSNEISQLISEYAKQANSQTAEHLKVWAGSTTQYTEQMNNAARALASVVDEIQDKSAS